jgi:dTMP kinase
MMTISSQRGLFITFEGGEGSGKTTQSKRLYEQLKNKGIPVIWTREPGGNTGAEDIRSLLVQGDANRWTPATEALLMFAARCDHWHRLIYPSLLSGTWVICDRFADSSYAYQGYGKGISLNFLKTLYDQTIGLSHQPNRTYFFDLPVDVGLSRAHARMHQQKNAEDRFEGMGHDFHERVRHGYQCLAATEPDRFLVCNAEKTENELEAIVWQDMQCLI